MKKMFLILPLLVACALKIGASQNDYKIIFDGAKKGNIEKVTEELEKGIDINFQQKNDLSTALSVAVLYNKTEMVKFLLDNGANPNVSHIFGSILLYASMTEASEGLQGKIVKLLINSEASLNVKDYNGNTALMKASEYAQGINVVKLLIDSGADLDLKNNKDKTALEIAKEQFKKEKDKEKKEKYKKIIDILIKASLSNIESTLIESLINPN